MAKNAKAGAGAQTDTPRKFWSLSSGRWAGERLLEALNAGSGYRLSSDALRTLDTLRKDEWVFFDEALIAAGEIRLRGIRDLIAAGLTRPVANSMGKTIIQYEKVTDMEPAVTSLDGMSEDIADRQEFELNSVPLPITHKDFFLHIRDLAASRERGEALDTMQVRTCGRLIAERLELMLFQGGPTYGGFPIYGYTTHLDRNQVAYGAGGAWNLAAKTGEQILVDLLTAITAAEADRFFGPYFLYVPSNVSTKLASDFKANSDKTIMSRLLEVDQVRGVTVADQCPAGHVVLVQATDDVVRLYQGEPLRTIQWDIQGGMRINFKAMTIQVPLITSDSEHRSGVVDMHA
jgi:hypothetical protein